MKKKMEVIKEEKSYKVETWDEVETKYSYLPDEDVLLDNETGEKLLDVYGEYMSYNQLGEVTNYINNTDLRPVDWDGLDYYTPQGRQDLTKIERFWGNDLTDDPSSRGWHIVRDDVDEEDEDGEKRKEKIKELRRQCSREFWDIILANGQAEVRYDCMCELITEENDYLPDREKLLNGEYNLLQKTKRDNEKKKRDLFRKWVGVFGVWNYDMVNILNFYKNGDINFDEFDDLMHPDGKWGQCYN